MKHSTSFVTPSEYSYIPHLSIAQQTIAPKEIVHNYMTYPSIH